MEEFEFRLRETKGSDILLRVVLGPLIYSREIKLNKIELINRQQQLITCLANFVDSNKNIFVNLKALAEEGYGAFRSIESQIDTDTAFKNYWDKEFLGRFSQKNIVIREAQDKRNVHMIFPKGYSFPFGLLFTKDPNKINFKKTPISEIIVHFFDLKFRIRNSFNEEDFADGLAITDVSLKDALTQEIKVIHAINDEFTTKIEESCWGFDSQISPVFVYRTKDLLSSWHKKEFPRIIHFSTHYKFFAQQSPSYQLTLSNKDGFSKEDLNKYGKPVPPKKAFFFLNACRSGSIQSLGYTDVLTDLFPNYSLGFIATLYDLLDASAGNMPQKFYEIFIQQGKNIFDSFIESKRYLILSRKEYSALGYLIWQVNPNLFYSKPNIKRPSLNKKKQKLLSPQK